MLRRDFLKLVGCLPFVSQLGHVEAKEDAALTTSSKGEVRRSYDRLNTTIYREIWEAGREGLIVDKILVSQNIKPCCECEGFSLWAKGGGKTDTFKMYRIDVADNDYSEILMTFSNKDFFRRTIMKPNCWTGLID